MDGQIQVWCGRRRCRNEWEWWQSRLKSGSFLVRVPGLWLCGPASMFMLSLVCGVQQWKFAFLFTPFPIGKQHSRLQRRVFVGAVARRWTQPLSLSPLACGLGGMHEMAYPSQDSISPSTLDSLAACLLSSEKPFHHRMTIPLLLLGGEKEISSRQASCISRARYYTR